MDGMPDALSAERMLQWLASFGRQEDGGVTRLLYDESWLQAQLALRSCMERLGLQPYFDDAGNLYGRLDGLETGGPTVLTGSHIDSVRSGGRYDGAYGIVAGILALDRLNRLHGPPRYPLEVVSFCEEEGSRFPLAFWGSGNATGRYDAARPPEAADPGGITLREAMAACGFGSGTHRPCERGGLRAFVELHIEQGAVLEREGVPLGVVDGIVGQQRWTAVVRGEANHAGTTPMAYRRDALAAASEMILAVERHALAAGAPLVGTVGRVEAAPNAGNVVAGEARFTLDVRSPSAEQLQRCVAALQTELAAIAERRGVTLELQRWLDARPVQMHGGLSSMLQQLCAARGYASRRMYSGAGHDAQLFAPRCPAAMLFVPSRGGISHAPEEYTAPEFLDAGIDVLCDLLYQLAYEGVPLT